MQPQAKDTTSYGQPEKLSEAWGRVLPEGLQRQPALPTPAFQTSGLQAVVLSHLVCDNVQRWPQEMTTPSKFSSKVHSTFPKTRKSEGMAPALTFPLELCESLTLGVVCLVLTPGLPSDRSCLRQWPGTQRVPPGCPPSLRPADLRVTGRHTSKTQTTKCESEITTLHF